MSCACNGNMQNMQNMQGMQYPMQYPMQVPSQAYNAFNVATGASGTQSPYTGRQVQMNLNSGYGSTPTPGCSLTSPAPPTACCNPAPLHCSQCNSNGFFLLTEAYGS